MQETAQKQGCLDDRQLDDFVHGRLRDERLAVVDTHLDSCPSCSGLVAELAASAPTTASPTLEPGATVARYTIQAVLGQGAMGVVYAARDPQLNRDVALKIVRADLADDPRVHARLLREAQAMARLSHPNVAAVYEVGEDGPRLYIAMELVRGSTLRDWMNANKRSWEDAHDVLLQAGEGLAAAHAAGIVHRDFKPENVIVGYDGRVRVTDFGLSSTEPLPVSESATLNQALGESATAPRDPVNTVKGALVGTPAYMAPEQLEGKGADALSDQFAFGVTCYEACFGVRPFVGESLEALRAAMRAELPKIEASRARGTPVEIAKAIARSLSREPASRHASVAAFLEALRKPGVTTRRGLLAAFAVAAVIAAFGVTFARTSSEAPTPVCREGRARADAVWNDARRQRVRESFLRTGAPFAREAVDQVISRIDALLNRWAHVRDATCAATFIAHEQSSDLFDAKMECLSSQRSEVDALVRRLEQAGRDTVAVAVDAVAALPDASQCGARDGSARGVALPASAEGRAELAAIDALLRERRADLAAGRYTHVLAANETLRRRVTALGYGPAMAQWHLLHARALRHTGALAESEAEARLAVVAADSSRDDEDSALAWLELLAANGALARWDQTDTLTEHARAAITRVGSPKPLLASLEYLVGVAKQNQGHLVEAETHLNAARAARVEGGAAGQGELARVWAALGNLARQRGQFEQALTLHRNALNLDGRRLGHSHPALAQHHHNVAGILRKLTRLDEAEDEYQAALAIEADGEGAESPAAGLTHNSLGLVALERGNLERAQRECELAMAILRRADHPDLGLALQNLGVIAQARGEHEQALAFFREAMTRDRQLFGDEHERVARTLKSMGHSLLALRRPSEGRRALNEAIEIAAPRAAESAEARAIVDEARAPAPRDFVGGSTGYGANQNWDPN